MSTPTPRTDEAWSSAFNAEDFSASSVARSMQVFSQKIEIELAAANEACRVASEDALLMRDDLYKQLAAATTERDQLRVDLELADVLYQRECEVEHELRTEVERLRSDRDCEKRLRKDADEFRENAIERAQRAEAEVKRLGHLEAVLRSCAFDKDGTAWKTVCGWWSKKYDAVERQMSENATRAELAEAELAAERARTKQIATALTDAISTYFGADKLVTAERIEAWQAALKEGTK